MDEISLPEYLSIIDLSNDELLIIDTKDATKLKDLLENLYSMYDSISDTDTLTKRLISIMFVQNVIDKDYILQNICILVDKYLDKHVDKKDIISDLFLIIENLNSPDKYIKMFLSKFISEYKIVLEKYEIPSIIDHYELEDDPTNLNWGLKYYDCSDSFRKNFTGIFINEFYQNIIFKIESWFENIEESYGESCIESRNSGSTAFGNMYQLSKHVQETIDEERELMKKNILKVKECQEALIILIKDIDF